MTEKLFYKDSYIKDFEATVTDCVKSGDEYKIVLDQTAFFPEGGGQSGDTGILNKISVLDTKEENGFVYHFTKEPVEIDTKVIGTLNFEERFSKMQQHTGEHIVSGLIHSRFGYDNVGFHLGKDQVTMDFNGVFQEEELKQIEYAANEIVASNREVEIRYPDKEELDNIVYRSKIEIEGQVRIVTIPQVDVCACCAPHVRYTGEIGLIKFTDAAKYKGGTRVSMVCGFRALLDYREKESSVNKISVLLSAKPELVSDAVLRQREEIQQYKDRMVYFQNLYIEEKLSQITETDECILLFAEDLDGNGMRKFVNEGMQKTKSFCACFCGNEELGFRYVIGSSCVDVRILAKQLSMTLGGKGGGKPNMVQGSVEAGQDKIRRLFKE